MDYRNVAFHLKDNYGITVDALLLHRASIGQVFFVDAGSRKYVFKVYRGMFEGNAIQTSRVLAYLREQGYPVPQMYKTITQENISYIVLETEECPGILFHYIDGEEPDEQKEASEIGYQLSMLHRTMKAYPGELINRSKYEYIDEFIEYMQRKGLEASKVTDLQEYGSELWKRIDQLPRYFCHGDFHTGNMIRNAANKYVFFDYDDMSGDWPIMDVAYLSDRTHFNNYSDSMFENVERQFESVYSGYGKTFTIGQEEYRAIFDFIAVRHYQIIARIIKCRGLDCISMETCDEQHDWLMRWNTGCQKRL